MRVHIYRSGFEGCTEGVLGQMEWDEGFVEMSGGGESLGEMDD